MSDVQHDEKKSLDDAPSEDAVHLSKLAHHFEDTPLEQKSSIFTIACCGFALISDGLQNNIFSLTGACFTQIYGSKLYTSAVSTRLANALTVGTILGQFFIGILCDYKGRKWGIVASTLAITVGIILCTAAHGANGSFIGFTWMFTVARGLTGIGLGGEYPSCSTSAAEAANSRFPKYRGPVFCMVTNFFLSFGTPFACILYLIVLQAAGGNAADLSTVWRVVFGISCIPPLAIFYFRFRMVNSTLYRTAAIQKVGSVPYGLTLRYYWKTLIEANLTVVRPILAGTAGAWFLYDFITFPNGVFSSVIISSVIHEKGVGLIRQTAEWQLLLGTIALPGCFVGALLVNKIGRKWTMVFGFSGYLIFGLAVGCAYDKVTKNTAGFIIMYGLMNSFANAGPGDMLGLTSSESYATAVRGTMYGFSAAIGKVGAVVGTQAFTPIRAHLGARWTFLIAAICGLAGMTVSILFIRNDLGGDLKDEDERFAAYLASKGWKGSMGADSHTGLITNGKAIAEVEALEVKDVAQ